MEPIMRILTLLVLLFIGLNVHADTDTTPEVTITQQSDTLVEEYRSHGRLYMIKITPKHGVPYYLIDERGDGKFARQDNLDSGLRVPRWIIKTF
ncbi:MAG: DUF2782 domain-containing protein [Sideroxydans sp.]|nr:DUF2782 domain-containing protein [Sideroxydans sp.]